jgi:uncharacterized protein
MLPVVVVLAATADHPVEEVPVIKSNLALLPNTPSTSFSSQRHALSLSVAPLQNNVLQFGQVSPQTKTKQTEAKQTGFSMKLAGLLAAASALILPSIVTAQSTGQGGQHPGINDAQIQQVNKASDLPFLNNSLKQPVVDLMNHPLLKPETKAQLNQLLNDLNSSGKAQMALVIIPDTANRELNTLATDLFNQIGIGQAGQNNGLLFLVNANAARENRDHGKMFIMPGAGLKYQFATGEAAKIIRDVGLPHLQNNDPDAAVKAVTEHLVNKLHAQRAAQSTNNTRTLSMKDGPAEDPWRQNNPWQNVTASDVMIVIAIIAALFILGVILQRLGVISGSSGGSYGGGGWSSGSSGGWSSGDSGGGGSWSSSSDFGGGVSDGGGGGGD